MAEVRKNRYTGIFLALLTKGAKLLKLVKFFKVAKPLTMFLTLSISAIAYAFYLGPWLAITFILLLLIHEMGHVAAMRMKNLGTPTPVFIPFLGAAVFAPKFEDRSTEAFVGYGGPLLGTLGCIAVFGLGLLFPHESIPSTVLLVGSYIGVMLNLFNLIPISPLDGGRITQAVGRWSKYIGLVTLAVLSILWKQPAVLYVWILVLVDLTMIPIRLRAGLVCVIWLSMATLMSMGYGDQPVWVNVFDCAITVMFAGVSIARAFGQVPDADMDDRPDLTTQEKVRWFMYYIGLSGFLVALLVFQLPFLPQHP